MRVPLSWLRELVPVDADPAAIADALDNLGLEVEAIDAPGRDIVDVRVAKALEVRKHPNADKLSLVDIDYGGGTTTVVCGAPNVVAGMVVPYAGSGSRLPEPVGVMERRKIRGEISDGMLCSVRDLGLGEEHAGILELAADAELGADVRDILELHDVVFELAITPDRPDAMSMIGVARELAAHFGLQLTVPEPSVLESGPPTASSVTVEVDAPDRCPRFTARRIDVVMGPSPEWLARRLTLAGMRPISNVVDVTNYVMLERGQPLHAFDLARLPGRGLVVRMASDGERLTTLDGIERVLTSEDLLICDAERGVQSIAGIMGGAQAEVHDGTSEILLEAAYFTPMGISKTSKRLGLRSEASARFERGIDPNGVLVGSTRAAELLAEVASGTVAPDPIDEYPEPVTRRRIVVRTERVNALLGVELSTQRMLDAVTPLGIETDAPVNGVFTAIAPTWRPDLEREIDIVEEVARRVGFNEIPRTLPHTTEQGGGLTPRQKERRTVADVMVGMGYAEAYTVPLIAEADLTRFRLPLDTTVQATNALRADEPVLRPAILPALLRAVAANVAHGLNDVALFELGHVFRVPRDGELLPDERDHLALVIAGSVLRSPIERDRDVDAYDATDAFHALRDALELANAKLVEGTAPGFLPGRSAGIAVDGTIIGHVGELLPATLEGFGVPTPVVALELDVDGLLEGSRRDRSFRPPSRFPASSVDLAFVADEKVTAAQIETSLRAAAGDALESARCFDEFRSDALGPRRRSLAFALRFRAPDHTLTDTEVGEIRQRCIRAVIAEHGAELRG